MRKKLLYTLLATVAVAYGGLLITLLSGTHPATGLDLQGGLSVTLQPKGNDYNASSLDLTVEKIRERIDSLGVAEPEILRQDNTVVVNLPGVKDQQAALDIAKISGKVYLRPVLAGCQENARPANSLGTTTTTSTTSTTAGTGSTATTGAVAASTPAGTAAATTAGTAATSTAGTAAVTTAKSGWRRSTATTTPATTPVTTASATPASAAGTTPATVATDATVVTDATATAGTEVSVTSTTVLDENGFPPSDPSATEYRPIRPTKEIESGYCEVGPAQADGTVFSDDASADVGTSGWEVVVSLREGASGADLWNSLAGQCYRGDSTCPSHQIAIELDGEIVSHPNVNDPNFTDRVSISGSFTESEARSLARVLQSGALPVELQVQAVQNISPSLGKESLHAAIIAGVVGVGLVLIFMAFYYRHLGLIAFAGLTVSGAILWTVISVLSKTQGLALSLAGVAGIIVSVGVTIDSYVVFFERLKDEVRTGRTLRNSAQRGFAGAWRTIVMADLVSLIGALVLWYLTVGSVRNFAFFLGLSTLIDLAVAWFFTRPAVLLLARTAWMGKRKVMGLEIAGEGAK